MSDKHIGHFRQYMPVKKYGPEKDAMLRNAVAITMHYEEAGIPLTVRQLYYQFVSKNLFANVPDNYTKLSDVVSEGRLAGLISWTAIEDRTRSLKGLETYAGPGEVVKAARDSYRIDMWANQDMRPEFWYEKDAMSGIIGKVCDELRIDHFSCRGYNSQSEQWKAGQRLAGYFRAGQRPIVFHLGDHDPSGIDMTRDNQERLSMFAGVQVQVVRIALNMNQIEQYKCPPNPAKLSDSRAEKYIEKFGDSSWELDALAPEILDKLVRETVASIRNEAKWSEAQEQEAEDKDTLDQMILKLGDGDDE